MQTILAIDAILDLDRSIVTEGHLGSVARGFGLFDSYRSSILAIYARIALVAFVTLLTFQIRVVFDILFI